MRKRRVVRSIYKMKYSWKGHKDRNKTQEQNKKEWASSVNLPQRHNLQHPHHVKASPWGLLRSPSIHPTFFSDSIHTSSFPPLSLVSPDKRLTPADVSLRLCAICAFPPGSVSHLAVSLTFMRLECGWSSSSSSCQCSLLGGGEVWLSLASMDPLWM